MIDKIGCSVHTDYKELNFFSEYYGFYIFHSSGSICISMKIMGQNSGMFVNVALYFTRVVWRIAHMIGKVLYFNM